MTNQNQIGINDVCLESAQERFQKTYITSAEIMQDLKLTRSALMYARRAGKLPGAIDVNTLVFIWERDAIQPYLDAWKIILDAKRGG